MRYLFVHQNMPGQFGHLAQHLAVQAENEVAFVTRRSNSELRGVLRVTYDLKTPPPHLVRELGSELRVQALFGDAVIAACHALVARGFRPDVIVGHPGWGELLFIKDLFPDAHLVCYCEFYHRPDAVFFNGDPPSPLSTAARMGRRVGSAHLLLSLEAADRGWSPTRWQKSGFPKAYQDKIDVIFDGVDANAIAPHAEATFFLPDGRQLRRGDEVLTYTARSLEPSRGFPTFWRSLPEILEARPKLQVVVVGGDEPHYDDLPQPGMTWLAKMRQEVKLDTSRVHLIKWLTHEQLIRLYQVSRLHIYLSNPSVLSWSMVEAMSAGCIVLGSSTPPVCEMIADGTTGLLTPFADSSELSLRAVKALAQPPLEIGRNARDFVLNNLDLACCLPMQVNLLSST